MHKEQVTVLETASFFLGREMLCLLSYTCIIFKLCLFVNRIFKQVPVPASGYPRYKGGSLLHNLNLRKLSIFLFLSFCLIFEEDRWENHLPHQTLFCFGTIKMSHAVCCIWFFGNHSHILYMIKQYFLKVKLNLLEF